MTPSWKNFIPSSPNEWPLCASTKKLTRSSTRKGSGAFGTYRRIHHKTRILIGGNYLTPGDHNTRKPFQFPEPQPEWRHTGRRLALAQWLTQPDHPLTARVMVNRVWQYHFGEGIVRTPDDFGSQGIPPTHPELLDWLATSFVEHGWSLKWLHKQIMLSAAYRQSSAEDPAKLT